MNILISQRDEKDAHYLEIAFKELGHRTNCIENIDSIESLENLSSYDLVILDTEVGDISGIEICKDIREVNKNIVIVFISENDDTATKIKAFDYGADDYITRPFAFAELVARVKSIIRRKNPTENGESILKVGDLTLNYHTREVKRGNEIVELTTKEFLLLEYFMKNRNILLTRTLIREHIWGIDFLTDTNIVDVYVTRLRNKIDRNHENKFFYTIRGAGYMLKG